MENSDNLINETSETYSIPEILEAFKTFDGSYKREQIDAAILKKQEITPRLIEILENALAGPQQYAEDGNLYDHIYAVMLLGHFKEPKAHKLIIDLFSLPGDLADQMFGDICTMDLPLILLNTCGGDVEAIRSMILNRKADDFCRVSACQALAYAVLEGMVSREAVIAFLNTLFTGEEAEPYSDFWGLTASIIHDLYPEESMEVIRKGYDDELIFPGMIELSDFEKAFSLGKEKCLEKVRRDFERDCLDDLHSRMSWWSCFNKNTKHAVSSYDSNCGGGKLKKTEKTQKKKKRKQAKASKKKNRR